MWIEDLVITLRAVRFEERSQIVTGLSERYGKITGLAKNSVQSRRFSGAFDMFSASLWKFKDQGKDLFLIESADLKRPYTGIRSNFDKIALAGAFNEIMLKVAQPEIHSSDLFKLHANALLAVEEAEKVGSREQAILLAAFFAKILQWSGCQPALGACLRCQQTLANFNDADYFTGVIDEGGWICTDCRIASKAPLSQFFRIDRQAIPHLEMIWSQPIRKVQQLCNLSTESYIELLKYLKALVEYHIPGFDRVPIKSMELLSLRDNPAGNV